MIDPTTVVEWQVPTRLVFGRHCLTSTGVETAALGTRSALVIDRSVSMLPVVRSALEALRASGVHIAVVIKVDGSPDSLLLRDHAVRIGAAGCDVVVAIGGGSTMDSGKLLALAATNPGLLEDRSLDGQRVIQVDDRSGARPRPGLPSLLVPSTSATGSEVNTVAALAHQGHKTLVVSGLLAATTAVIDPVLSDTLTPKQIAEGGVETFARLACPYLLSGDALATTDLLAEQLAAHCLVVTNEATAGPDALGARSDLAWLVTVSGTQLAGLGRPAWAHVLWYLQDAVAELTGSTKGTAMAALLPTYLAVVSEGMSFGSRLGTPARLARLGRVLASSLGGPAKADRLVASRLTAWGLPTSLNDLGLRREHLQQTVRMTHEQWGSSGRLNGVSSADLCSFYDRAWSGETGAQEHPAPLGDHQLSTVGRR